MDKERIMEIINKIDRIADSAQDLARSTMDKEPSQKSQNNYWRYLKQDLRDLKKMIEEA